MKIKVLISLIVIILIACGVAAYATYQKITDLQDQMKLKQGFINERDESLMKADIKIGRLTSVITTAKNMKEAAEDMLNVERGEWGKEKKRYKWKIDSLTQANAELQTRIDDILGSGGVFFSNEELTDSSSVALTKIKEILLENGVTMGWEFVSPDRRIVVRTKNVLQSPPVASVETNQHFQLDQMIVRTRTGAKQGYLRLFETKPDGTIIGKATNVTGDFNWEPETPKWHDYLLAGFRIGIEVNEESDARIPLYGQIGYQHLKGVPWAVTIDPFIEVNGREDPDAADNKDDSPLKLGYGIGLYFHLRKP